MRTKVLKVAVSWQDSKRRPLLAQSRVQWLGVVSQEAHAKLMKLLTRIEESVMEYNGVAVEACVDSGNRASWLSSREMADLIGSKYTG